MYTMTDLLVDAVSLGFYAIAVTLGITYVRIRERNQRHRQMRKDADRARDDHYKDSDYLVCITRPVLPPPQ